MERIGLIGAMPMEVAPVLARLERAREERIGPSQCWLGALEGAEVVVECCGIGKVNAAMGAQAMLQAYRINRVVHLGVGGALSGGLRVGDVVVAEGCVQYDVDTTALGDLPGFVSTVEKIVFDCDAQMRKEILAAAEAMPDRSFDVRSGVVATGDRFLTRAEEKRKIVQAFHALICDQESCAIAQVCGVNGVPMAVIRAVSDAADGAHAEEFARYAQLAVQNGFSVLLRYLQRPSEGSAQRDKAM